METRITILEAADINRIITRMAYEILETYKGVENLALIGIQTRGVHLARRIQASLKKVEGSEIPVGVMDITLYRDDWTKISSNPIVKATDVSFPVDEKHIVLVDDVLYTGRTIRAAMDAVFDFGRPDRIELAVLVDRGFRELPIQADYFGKFVKTVRAERVNVMLSEQDGKDMVIIEQEKV